MLLRRILPPAILAAVILYQLLFVRYVHEWGASYHYSVEIVFYGLVGPVVTWGVLTWIERKLQEKERAEARARRERSRREDAVRAERARIAREIHEGVSQNLYFLGIQLDVSRKLATQEPERVEQELAALQDLLHESIGDLRRLIWALRPVELEQLGPLEAARRLASELRAQLDLNIEVTVEGEERRFDPEIEGTLYRFTQEALNNVAKHAEAQHAWVGFKLDRGRAEVRVRDDGRGFDTAAARNDGYGLGLRHLRERVEQLDGAFTVESKPGEGTRVAAVIPLHRKEGVEND